jgi:fatty acid desaturase
MTETVVDAKNATNTATAMTEETRDIAYYRKKIMPLIPQSYHERQPVRVIYAGLFMMAAGLMVWATLTYVESWALKILVGLAIGQMTAGMAFLSHEMLHGSILKSRKAQDFVSFFTFAPFLMSPTFWRFWHNKLHHGNTQDVIHDPDCFPNMFIFKRSKIIQAFFKFTPGSRTFRSYFYFLFWFSFQTAFNQIYMRFRNNMWKQLDQKRVTVEFSLQVAMIAGYLYLIGPSNWFFLAVIPFFAQNYTLMSYISTNHNLSPLTKENDPLENSLSVTVHPLIEKFHFNFGYHVEHHIFPTMSGAFTKQVHFKLKENFPETYKCIPKLTAMKKLYQTSRVYKNSKTLIHPYTLETFETI